MAIREISFAPGCYYHIYNRGNSKQKIFLDKNDYHRFIKLLYISNSRQNFAIRNFSKKNIYDVDRGQKLVSMGAFCLMSNHFHILLCQPENGDISKFMQKLSTSYSMYFNKKYERTGGLFESKFKSEYVETDRHLKYLFSYIHLNPLKIVDPKWREKSGNDLSGSMKFLENYNFSSFDEYIGKSRIEQVILDRQDFPEYFPAEKIFLEEITEWINFT